MAYIYSLDGVTTWVYTSYVAVPCSECGFPQPSEFALLCHLSLSQLCHIKLLAAFTPRCSRHCVGHRHRCKRLTH